MMNLNMIKRATLVLSLVFLSNTALSAFVLSPSISYSEREVEENNTNVESKLTTIDFRIGYTLDFGLYFGGLYSLQDENLFGQESSDSYAGLSVGYEFMNWFLVGTYYLYGEKDLNTGGVKYSGGTGYQLDLTYMVPITDMLFLGPQISYFVVDFKDQQVNGVSSTADYEVEGITPAFNVTFKF